MVEEDPCCVVMAEIERLRGERKWKILEALFLGYVKSVNRGGISVTVDGAIAPISIILDATCVWD